MIFCAVHSSNILSNRRKCFVCVALSFLFSRLNVFLLKRLVSSYSSCDTDGNFCTTNNSLSIMPGWSTLCRFTRASKSRVSIIVLSQQRGHMWKPINPLPVSASCQNDSYLFLRSIAKLTLKAIGRHSFFPLCFLFSYSNRRYLCVLTLIILWVLSSSHWVCCLAHMCRARENYRRTIGRVIFFITVVSG